MARRTTNTLTGINDELNKINQLLTEAIQQGKTSPTSDDVKNKVNEAISKTDKVLKDDKLEMQDFENLVNIYQKSKQIMTAQRVDGATVQNWEKEIEGKEAELAAKKTVIDSENEKFDKAKVLESEKQKRDRIEPEIEKKKKIWKSIKEIRNHYKKKLETIKKELEKVEKIKEEHPEFNGKTLKELRDGIQQKKVGKEAELQQKETNLRTMGAQTLSNGMSIVQAQTRISELKSEIKAEPSIFKYRDKVKELDALENLMNPYNTLKEEIKVLKEEVGEFGDQIKVIDGVYKGIKAVITDVNRNNAIAKEAKDYMNGYLTSFEQNYESEELEILLAGDMAHSDLAMEARREQENYNNAVNRIGVFEKKQEPTTPATPARQTNTTQTRTVPTTPKGEEENEKGKGKKGKGKKKKNEKGKNKKDKKSTDKTSCWELELMTEAQKRDAAIKYYKNNGRFVERFKAKIGLVSKKRMKKWEEYFSSQVGKTVSESDSAQIQKETTDEWRKKLLHTVAAKAQSTSGYELTDDERDDLYK